MPPITQVFSNFTEVARAGIKLWPNAKTDMLSPEFSLKAEPHRCRVDHPQGSIVRYLIDTNQGLLCIPQAAGRALDREVQRLGVNAITPRTLYMIQRTGHSYSSVYDITWKSTTFGVNPCAEVALVNHGACAVPAVKAACVCPIKDLLSNGHNAGCAEKR